MFKAKWGFAAMCRHLRTQEPRMNRVVIRLLTLAMFSVALVAAPVLARTCAAGGDPPPTESPPTNKGKKKTSENGAPINKPAFADGYRAAYATGDDRNDYASAIEQLKTLGP